MPVNHLTILEKDTETAEASTSQNCKETAPIEPDQIEKETAATKETVDSDKSTDKETATVEPAQKRLKLQRTILVDGFQLEKQFRLPTQAVPFGIVYPARDNLPINNPFEDHNCCSQSVRSQLAS